MGNLNMVRRALFTKSYYEFLKYFWDTIEVAKFKDNWHIKYLCDTLQEAYIEWKMGLPARDIIINIPPGLSKTTIFTRLFNAWLWIPENSPESKVISCSYSIDIAAPASLKTKDCLVSTKYKELYPEIRLRQDSQSKSNFENNYGGFRYAVGITGSVTGKHADFIFVDDGENPFMAQSKAQRTSTITGLNTLATRKTDSDRTLTVYIQQRLDAMDITGWLKANDGSIRHICLPAKVSSEVYPKELIGNYIDGYLDPVRLGENALAKLKIRLGTRNYMAQIDQNPTSSDSGLIKREWLKTWRMYDGWDKEEHRLEGFVDTAQEDGEKNDYTVVLIAYRSGNDLYVVACEKRKLTYPEQKKFVRNMYEQYGLYRMSIEKKTNGSALIYELRAEGKNIKEIPRNKGDGKYARANAMSPVIESGRVHIREGLEDLMIEVCSYPNVEHDDQTDTLLDSIEVLLKVGKKYEANMNTDLC